MGPPGPIWCSTVFRHKRVLDHTYLTGTAGRPRGFGIASVLLAAAGADRAAVLCRVDRLLEFWRTRSARAVAMACDIHLEHGRPGYAAGIRGSLLVAGGGGAVLFGLAAAGTVAEPPDAAD